MGARSMPIKPVHNKFQPTDEQRRYVETMAGMGLRLEDISKIFGIHIQTVRRAFRKELETGHAKANLKVAESLFQNATKHNNVTAQIFWLKTRAKWVMPKQEIEAVVTINDELAESTDAELIERAKRLTREITALAARTGLDRGDAEGEGGEESTPDVSSLH